MYTSSIIYFQEFQTPYGKNSGTCKNSYVIGDKLVLFLNPDGVIQVWDRMVNHVSQLYHLNNLKMMYLNCWIVRLQITFDISDLKGAKIVSLYNGDQSIGFDLLQGVIQILQNKVDAVVSTRI